MIDPIIEKFQSLYHCPPEAIVVAPGRVNLIGEHTDYNEGFVLPAAIDRSVRIAFRLRQDDEINIHSDDFDGSARIDRQKIGERSTGWVEYIKAVAETLLREGISLKGWDGVLKGNVPIGAGLSSSAAFEMAVARACVQAAGVPWEPVRMAQLAQKAENERIGVQCGIMDQLTSACGQAGHALLIDCRDLHFEQIKFPEKAAIVVMDTTTRRELADSNYNSVRARCDQAAKYLSLHSLRDLTLEKLEKSADVMDATLYHCARHVVTENQRTLKAAEALRKNDLGAFGKLMNESHVSLRDDLRVSNEPMDKIVEISVHQAACYGARMTGAGFGGCAVALIDSGKIGEFVKVIETDFFKATGIHPKVYPCSPANGVHIERLTPVT